MNTPTDEGVYVGVVDLATMTNLVKGERHPVEIAVRLYQDDTGDLFYYGQAGEVHYIDEISNIEWVEQVNNEDLLDLPSNEGKLFIASLCFILGLFLGVMI